MIASHPDGTARPAASRRGVAAARLGLLSACAVAVYIFESFLPSPFPWARIGLSNAVVVTALFVYGTADAFMVNLVRIVAGNLVLGIVLSPAFLLSFAGSMCALVAMASARSRLAPPLSVVGVSVIGATVNNVVQALLFGWLFAASVLPGDLLGGFVMMGAAVGFGTGLVSAVVLAHIGIESTRGVN